MKAVLFPGMARTDEKELDIRKINPDLLNTWRHRYQLWLGDLDLFSQTVAVVTVVVPVNEY